MNNAVAMTVIQRAGDLSSELASLLFFEFAMRNNIVEHLATVDVFEQHVPMVGGAHDVAHATDVRMVHETDDGGFTGGSDFLGAIGPFRLARTAMLFKGLSWDDFDGRLYSC